MKKYNLIVFDWDGTLYDSGSHIVQCVQRTAKDLCLDIPEKKDIRNIIGLRSDVGMRQLFPTLNLEELNNFIQKYRNHVYSDEYNKPALFPGSRDVLKKLIDQKYKLAIATGKSRFGLDSDLEYLNLNKIFIATECSDESFSKPNPQMLLDILAETAVNAHDTLMIGDTEYDMEFARNAGVDALGVNYGMHEEKRLLEYGAMGCLNDISELPGSTIIYWWAN